MTEQILRSHVDVITKVVLTYFHKHHSLTSPITHSTLSVYQAIHVPTRTLRKRFIPLLKAGVLTLDRYEVVGTEKVPYYIYNQLALPTYLEASQPKPKKTRKPKATAVCGAVVQPKATTAQDAVIVKNNNNVPSLLYSNTGTTTAKSAEVETTAVCGAVVPPVNLGDEFERFFDNNHGLTTCPVPIYQRGA